MVAKLRSCCRIAAPIGGSAAWPTSEEPARIAMRAAQNGTFQRVSRRSAEDVIGASHDSTAEVLRRWRDVRIFGRLRASRLPIERRLAVPAAEVHDACRGLRAVLGRGAVDAHPADRVDRGL